MTKYNINYNSSPLNDLNQVGGADKNTFLIAGILIAVLLFMAIRSNKKSKNVVNNSNNINSNIIPYNMGINYVDPSISTITNQGSSINQNKNSLPHAVVDPNIAPYASV